jgi:hypothetical protein
VIRRAGGRGTRQADTVVAIDVSGSMSNYLNKPEFQEIMRNIIDDHCATAALIDVEIHAVVPLDELPAVMKAARAGNTDLEKPSGSFSALLSACWW